MADTLSPQVQETVLQVTRTIFPHDNLPDEAYMKVVTACALEDGGPDTIAAGAEQLNQSRPFGELGAEERLEALKSIEDSEFFKLVHATAVVELYDNPAVWKAFGYEGPSAHLGGYVNRGFDDLDWLPEPELVSAAKREMPSAATPETTQKFTTPPVNAPATA